MFALGSRVGVWVWMDGVGFGAFGCIEVLVVGDGDICLAGVEI